MHVKDIIHRLSRYVNENIKIRKILNLNKGGFCFIVRRSLFADTEIEHELWNMVE